MNSRHAYHAGNFADVVKHVVLVEILRAMLRKEAAIFYLDTHAGLGVYDLGSEAALRSREFESGIGKFAASDSVPEPLSAYTSLVYALNESKAPGEQCYPRWYPGSPWIAQALLRAQDRMVFCELHPDDSKILKKEFQRDQRVLCLPEDGYLAVKAVLPPRESRGLVLLDPPYEKENELEKIMQALRDGRERFAHGVFALWYPLKGALDLDLKSRAAHLGFEKGFELEFSPFAEDVPGRLNGCGMLVFNPPWKLDLALRETSLPVLARLIGEPAARFHVKSF